MIVITIVVLIFYYVQEADYKKEIEKLSKLENQKRLELQQLELLRSQTKPCQAGNFLSPRSCYIDSGYSCSWNELTDRCEAK